MTAIPQLTTPNIAVIGAGSWGKNLVRNYASLNALKLICDKNPDILGQFGRHAFVGAGTVVTHDVPDYALVMGNPARQVGCVCRCGNKLDKYFHCVVCDLTIRDLSMTQHF
jgi:6-phosphogluconate dehydrogenase